MKRRKTKNSIRKSERWVRKELNAFLVDTGISEVPTGLNWALASLVGDFSHLVWPARAKCYWVDDLEWSEFSVLGRELRGSGIVWWGDRNNVAGEMVSTP